MSTPPTAPQLKRGHYYIATDALIDVALRVAREVLLRIWKTRDTIPVDAQDVTRIWHSARTGRGQTVLHLTTDGVLEIIT